MKRLILLCALLLLTGTFMFTATAQDETAAPHWWQEVVWYQVFVRSFYDSDGDGIGDLQGLIQKLDYLNDGDPETTDDLGVGGIWLMPITKATSYHGYDTEDYYDIDPDYGTLDDFRQLIEEAHARGIAVIMDLVVNHTSIRHPWFLASRNRVEPYTNWFIWEDENPGYAGPWGAPAWHQWNDRYYYGVFWSGMPDLNYNNPDVVQEMYNIARFWLEDVGVDGFRLDAVKHIVEDGIIQEMSLPNREWLINFHNHVLSVNPQAFSVAEYYNVPTFRVASQIRQGAASAAFDFDFADAILSVVQSGNKRNVENKQNILLDEYPAFNYATFLRNHDQPRLNTVLRGDIGMNKTALSILLTSPGAPFIYYGEEIGMVGPKPDERIRTPMQWDGSPTAGFTTGRPWEPLADNHETVHVAAQTDDPDSLLSHVRALIHLRSSYPALHSGTLTFVNTRVAVYSFLRHNEDETLLVVINLSREPVDEYTLALRRGPLSGPVEAELLFGAGDVTAPQVNDEGGFEDYMPLAELPPHSTFIIRLGP